MTLVMIIG